MQYFFSTNISNDKIILSKEESIHCVKVLRHNIGDSIFIIDGKGNRFSCKISLIDNGIVEAQVVKKEDFYSESKSYIHIMISPTKSSQRFEWFVEKAVEIGVNEISFVKCKNSERSKINIDRVRKIALTAAKQSLKASIPIINDICDIELAIMQVSEDYKYIEYLNQISNDFLHNIAPKDSSYCLLIGPEGDFSDKEVELSIQNNFRPVLLSDFRLRTETAAVAGCLALNQINYDKSR